MLHSPTSVKQSGVQNGTSKNMGRRKFLAQSQNIRSVFSNGYQSLKFALRSRTFQSLWVHVIKLRQQIKTVKEDKAGYWCASPGFHWYIWSFHLALIYLYHFLKIFGTQSLAWIFQKQSLGLKKLSVSNFETTVS